MLEFSLIVALACANSPSTASPSIEPAASIEVADVQPRIDFTFQPTACTDGFSMGALPESAAIQEIDAGPGAAPTFGTAESWRWMIQAGYGTDADNVDMGLAGAGLSYFIEDNISIDFELNALYVHQSGDDAIGANLNLLFRWHFLTDEARTWSIYVDAGAGLLLTHNDVPASGSSFNFTPQAGMGVSFDIGDEGARMLIGGRWHHVSNANLYDENPGRDAGMFYAQLSFPF